MIQTQFNVVSTLSAWVDDYSEDQKLDNILNEDFDDFDSLMGEDGLLANIL